jgi:galactokinase/mevalonate kinase-like predicted kinase
MTLVEIDLLREPAGKQDQFIAAYGSVTCFEFNKEDSVKVTTAAINQSTKSLRSSPLRGARGERPAAS